MGKKDDEYQINTDVMNQCCQGLGRLIPLAFWCARVTSVSTLISALFLMVVGPASPGQSFFVYRSAEPTESKPSEYPITPATPSSYLDKTLKPAQIQPSAPREKQKLLPAELFQADLLSAKFGDSTAQLSVGLKLYSGQGTLLDKKSGLNFLLEAAEQGKYTPESLNILGHEYYKGTTVPRNYVEARKWLRLAADNNNPQAQNDLAYLLYNGLGGETDYVTALEWYEKAAIQGNTFAQANLGVMYANGLGTIQDKAKGYAWYNLAASSGNMTALSNRDTLMPEMSWEELNAAQRLSVEFFKAVEQAKASRPLLEPEKQKAAADK